MEKKLFAIDLDGTLLNKEEFVSEKSKEVIKRLTDDGHIACIITGRTFNMAKQIYDSTGLKTPMGLFNGGAIISPHNDFENHINKMDKELVKTIMKNKLLNEITSGIAIETLYETYVDNLDNPTAELSQKWTGKVPNIYNDIDEIQEDIIVLLAELNTGDSDLAHKLIEQVKVENENLEISYWYSSHVERYMIEISSLTSRKDYALIKLAKHFNIDMKNTIAFGDGGNDEWMLKNAGVGYAMKNAKDDIKAFTGIVTEFTNDEDGVAKEIEKILGYK